MDNNCTPAKNANTASKTTKPSIKIPFTILWNSKKAIKDLEAKNIDFEVIDITENPPSKKVLKSAIKVKGLQKLFNTSGVQYRELKIKDKLKSMTEAEAIDLLASNGRLIKRPIAVDMDKITVGFDADEYKQVWGK
ncbi:Spx/MgsR family RNA polymerase-binding regulatory protein [bacterium AH-315-C08]|nr:Spx/MgsR family RNA polymerase-binding regulatory protein [bacterium AH-315-C08]